VASDMKIERLWQKEIKIGDFPWIRKKEVRMETMR
jgi:hypothetical protein